MNSYSLEHHSSINIFKQSVEQDLFIFVSRCVTQSSDCTYLGAILVSLYGILWINKQDIVSLDILNTHLL